MTEEETSSIMYVQTHGVDEPTKSATPFFLSAAAAAMDIEAGIYFTMDGATLLKKGVADPEGANTKKTLQLLGFQDVEGVEFSKCFTIHMAGDDTEKARVQVEEMCQRLLANPVIQNYAITQK